MENDGVTEGPHRLAVNVHVSGDEVIADFTGTAPQARGPINATYAVTASATYNAIFQLTDPDVPRNAGCYRPIRIVAPPGTLVNVRHPGAEIGGNSETHCRIIGTVMGALAEAVPDRAAAADGASGCNFLFGGLDPETGDFYANYHFENVGWGAGARPRRKRRTVRPARHQSQRPDRGVRDALSVPDALVLARDRQRRRRSTQRRARHATCARGSGTRHQCQRAVRPDVDPTVGPPTAGMPAARQESRSSGPATRTSGSSATSSGPSPPRSSRTSWCMPAI